MEAFSRRLPASFYFSTIFEWQFAIAISSVVLKTVRITEKTFITHKCEFSLKTPNVNY